MADLNSCPVTCENPAKPFPFPVTTITLQRFDLPIVLVMIDEFLADNIQDSNPWKTSESVKISLIIYMCIYI